MIILDSDHLTVLRYLDTQRAAKLVERLDRSAEMTIATTIVNVEESMRGWMASIAKERIPARQVFAYRELGELFPFFSGFTIALWSEFSADTFASLRRVGVRIGTRDLKIGCIALEQAALLLTANRRDFERIPGLRFENWLE